MTKKPDSSYCPGCGTTVKIFALLADGDYVYRCTQCGMEVEPQGAEDQQTSQPQKEGVTAKMQPSPPEDASKAKPTPPHKKLAHIMIAEDSKLLSELLNDLLIGEGFANKVSSSLDGDNFIQKFTESLINKTPPNLIILDINLPAIDGMNICVSIRAIEKAFGLEKPRPILFFTSREIDSQLKKILDTYPPARYINKGREADPKKLAERIKKVMEVLLK